MNRVYATVFAVLAIACLYALTASTGNDSSLTHYFWWIVSASALLILLLLMILLRSVWLLRRDSRHNMLGSRLSRRLALMFSLVTLLPALFLFGVSAQFIASSINSWFGDDTNQALERSLELSKSALNLAADGSLRQAQALRQNIADNRQQMPSATERSPISEAGTVLQEHALSSRFEQLSLFDLGNKQSQAVRNTAQLPLPTLDADTAAQLNQTGVVRGLESVNGKLYVHGWLKLPSADGTQALFFRQAIPEKVARDAELIEAARSKYAELSYAKQGLQTFFLITLLVAALLSVMLALVIALYFARRFLEPILSLADGAKAVAQGDFSQQRPIYRDDELGRLTDLFNHMTEQLRIAQIADEEHKRSLEAARHYLETVLESISAGVMTLSADGNLITYNQSAENILGLPLENLLGTPWQNWANGNASEHLLSELLQTVLTTAEHNKPLQTAWTGGDEARILLGKATALPDDNGKGSVLVFDDITALVRAQKEAAWGEVAQRLAHEIRNPLTPIQLAAERLEWKLSDKLAESDANILQRSTNTIIKQVAALKEMVEAFRNYARSPSLKLEKLDLNAIVNEVLILYEGAACRFHAQLSEHDLPVLADTTALRQILHNLFKNAAEAAESDEKPQVWVQTEQQSDKVLLQVCNNGKSFSKEMLLNAFEPYVTDKATGTGLGLPVVKKLLEEHQGNIALSNRSDGGAIIRITLPLMIESV
ncbi:MAG: PAS domain-containing sensor histidine kinase [Neisseria sp.]|nr:PAS domain-containing sensor histidine kinase [Neisseria sp.]